MHLLKTIFEKLFEVKSIVELCHLNIEMNFSRTSPAQLEPSLKNSIVECVTCISILFGWVGSPFSFTFVITYYIHDFQSILYIYTWGRIFGFKLL